MNRRNYQRELEQVLLEQENDLSGGGRLPSLLIHSCCAPCSSYVLEYLSQYFAITVYYYNPNIAPAQEYEKRVKEQERLIRELPVLHPVAYIAAPYDPEPFYQAVKGLELEPEGKKRCAVCFRLRLAKAAGAALRGGFDYFTTTLTISPMKSAEQINEIGEQEARKAGVRWLPSDFKKKEGYKRSIELSHEYHLYRQDYCGCIFSRNEKGREKNDNSLDSFT